MQIEVTWALSNVAGGTVSQAQNLVALGFVPHFVAMLSGSVDHKREVVDPARFGSSCPHHPELLQAAYALLNLGSHGCDMLQLLMQANALQGGTTGQHGMILHLY